jgi:hypothetical protein
MGMQNRKLEIRKNLGEDVSLPTWVAPAIYYFMIDPGYYV